MLDAGSLSLAAQKQTLRQELRAIRDQKAPPCDSAEARAASAAVAAQLAGEAALLGATSVALFARIGSELDPCELGAQLRARGAALSYPRVLSRRPPVLGFFLAERLSDLRPASMGLREPPEDAAPAPPLDVFIVPGLGFDLAGRRIGYGGGYYDAALRAQPHALRIALGYDFQIVPRVPVGELDEPVDLVVTPTRRCVTAARPLRPRPDKEGSP